MLENERRVLQQFRTYLQKYVDPVTITNGLRIEGCIDSTQVKTLFDVSRSTNEDRILIWEKLWEFLLHSSFPTFLEVLERNGYSKLSLELFAHLQALNGEMREIIGPHKRTCTAASNKFAQELFISLKINTHNNVFRNPRENLHELSQRYRKKFLSEYDIHKKMAIADKYAACLCAEIDSHTMLYVRKFPTHGLFKELEDTVTETSNTNVTEVAFKSRIAIACAIAEDTERGEEFLKDARMASYHIGHCVQLENMMYIQIFNFLCQFENNPTEDLRNTILKLAEISLQTLEEEEEVARNFWKRMILLRMVYCLLGISNRCDLIPRCSVRPIHINKAKSLMAEIDKIWDGIESRRKMFYYVARARISEISAQERIVKTFRCVGERKTNAKIATAHIELAIHELNKAIDLGLEGKFGETKYVQVYVSHLKKQKQDMYFHDTMRQDRSGQEHSDITHASASTHEFRIPSITTDHQEENMKGRKPTEHDEHKAVEHEDEYKPSERKHAESKHTSDIEELNSLFDSDLSLKHDSENSEEQNEVCSVSEQMKETTTCQSTNFTHKICVSQTELNIIYEHRITNHQSVADGQICSFPVNQSFICQPSSTHYHLVTSGEPCKPTCSIDQAA